MRRDHHSRCRHCEQSEWAWPAARDRKSTRLNSSHLVTAYAVSCLNKKSIERRGCLGRHRVLLFQVTNGLRWSHGIIASQGGEGIVSKGDARTWSGRRVASRSCASP